MRNRKTESTLLPGECRVIRVSKDGLFELIYETMIERMEEYFDIFDLSCMIYHWGMADTLDSFYFGIHDSRCISEPSPMDILPLIGYTTESLVGHSVRSRYKTIYQKGSAYEIDSLSCRKVKHLRDGEYRFIRATYTALVEFAQDAVIKNRNYHFHLDKRSKVKWVSQVDENLNFIFAVYNKSQEEPDLSKLSQEVGITTDSFFSPYTRYRSVFNVRS